MVKDEEIDIIAWRPRTDGAAGTYYLLGQVASGDNWMAKSIKGGPIDYFHRTWFELPPASQATASIFIPHAVPPVGDGNRRERLDLLVAKFGTIFDRLRVAPLAAAGIALAAEHQEELLIERIDEVPNVRAWVTAQAECLRLSAERAV